MRIIGPPSADRDTVLASPLVVQQAHPRFGADMLPALWDAAELYSVDPVGAVAQAYKETGAGNFGGKVKPEFYNTCGLKIRHQGLFPGITDADNPLAHAMFPSWQVGATAHIQHLCAYAGHQIDFCVLIVDPRYTLIGLPYVTDFEQLGGRWAPSLTYGQEIVAIARRLQGRA